MALNKSLINEYMFDGHFGLEKESLRVDTKGFLAKTEHPFNGNKQVDRDFCENQIEIITSVHDSIDEMYKELTAIHNHVVKTLYSLDSGKEYIWNYSNPPYVRGDDDINIAQYSGRHYGKQMYREYLSQKYGKKKMLYSGIHFNFSFSDEYLMKAFSENGEKDFKKFKNELYLNLSKKVLEYGWLVVYLTAASPVIDGSFLDSKDMDVNITGPYSSRRCSSKGYWNEFVPILDYNNLNLYVDSIQEYIDCGQLKTATELYYPVRLKPAGENTLERLKDDGVDHIELRNIDLNPLSPIGIMKEDIEFIHLLLIYLTLLHNEECSNLKQMTAVKNIKKAARLDDSSLEIETAWGEQQSIRDLTIEILDNMQSTFEKIGYEKAKQIISFQKKKITVPNKRYADKVSDFFEESYVGKELEVCEEFARELI